MRQLVVKLFLLIRAQHNPSLEGVRSQVRRDGAQSRVETVTSLDDVVLLVDARHRYEREIEWKRNRKARVP